VRLGENTDYIEATWGTDTRNPTALPLKRTVQGLSFAQELYMDSVLQRLSSLLRRGLLLSPLMLGGCLYDLDFSQPGKTGTEPPSSRFETPEYNAQRALPLVKATASQPGPES